MDRNPRIAFGLSATTVALKAKTGRLQLRDQVEFAAKALAFVPEDEAARGAVLDFLSAVRSSPIEAGARLQDFIAGWEVSFDPLAPERTLQRIGEEAAVEFDWQKRADLQ